MSTIRPFRSTPVNHYPLKTFEIETNPLNNLMNASAITKWIDYVANSKAKDDNIVRYMKKLLSSKENPSQIILDQVKCFQNGVVDKKPTLNNYFKALFSYLTQIQKDLEKFFTFIVQNYSSLKITEEAKNIITDFLKK
jgi:hypothetical protein